MTDTDTPMYDMNGAHLPCSVEHDVEEGVECLVWLVSRSLNVQRLVVDVHGHVCVVLNKIFIWRVF